METNMHINTNVCDYNFRDQDFIGIDYYTQAPTLFVNKVTGTY